MKWFNYIAQCGLQGCRGEATHQSAVPVNVCHASGDASERSHRYVGDHSRSLKCLIALELQTSGSPA